MTNRMKIVGKSGFIFGILLWIFAAGPSIAQTSPGWTYGYVPTTAQWNAQWASKQDYLGAAPLLTTGGTMTGRLTTAASGTAASGFNLPPGVAPTSPNNGDLWTTGSGLYVQINGGTVGPITAAGGGSFAGTSPINVAFPAGVVTYSFNFAVANTFLAPQTAQGATTTSPGWYAQIAGDTVPRVRVGMDATDVASIAFGPGNATRDVFIERAAAGQIRFGAPDAASPVQQGLNVQNVVVGTSNGAGANLTVNGSRGTGTGVGGNIIFNVSPAGSSGSTQNALVAALTLYGDGGSVLGNPTGGDKGLGTVNAQGIYLNGKTVTDTSSVGAVLLLGSAGGGFAPYTGAACTNQFVTQLGSAGLLGCVTVTNAYLGTGSFPSITGVGTLAGLTVTGSFTATGLVTNGDLVNSSITINGSAVSLGGSVTVTAAASGVTVGTTTVTGGPGILYNTTSGGTLTALAAVSNAVVSYSGTTLQASTTLPSGLAATNMNLTTPTLGVAAGTSLALGGATIGGNALAVTGTVISGAHAITSASANALVVGLNGATNPAFNVDASTALQAAGLNVKGAVTGGTVALSLVDSGSNTNLIINAKGTGTIGIGSVSTGAVTITPTVIHSGTTILSAALTYGGVTLANSVTGTGSMVLATSPNLTTPALGVATATTVNGLTITANGTNTLNIAAGKTLTDTSGAGATLLLGTTGGGFTSYGGVNCTNQFLTGLGSAGASVCASVPTNTPIYMGNAFAFVNNGTTVFYGVNSSVTEAVVAQPAGPVVTVKNCYASVTAAAGAGNSWTYTLRQNGSNTAITWTVSGASQVLGSDLTHTVTLAATDLWDIQVVASLAVTPSVSHKITCTAVTTSP